MEIAQTRRALYDFPASKKTNVPVSINDARECGSGITRLSVVHEIRSKLPSPPDISSVLFTNFKPALCHLAKTIIKISTRAKDP